METHSAVWTDKQRCSSAWSQTCSDPFCSDPVSAMTTASALSGAYKFLWFYIVSLWWCFQEIYFWKQLFTTHGKNFSLYPVLSVCVLPGMGPSCSQASLSLGFIPSRGLFCFVCELFCHQPHWHLLFVSSSMYLGFSLLNFL